MLTKVHVERPHQFQQFYFESAHVCHKQDVFVEYMPDHIHVSRFIFSEMPLMQLKISASRSIIPLRDYLKRSRIVLVFKVFLQLQVKIEALHVT